MHLEGGRDVAFSYRDIPDGVHQLRDLYVLRAPLKTGITGGAEPDELAGKYFLLHSQDGHPDNLSRIISVRDLPDRTPGSAGSTREAPLDVFAARFFCDEQFKIRI